MGTAGAFMQNGRIHETGTIEELFHRPRTRQTAEFTGMDNIIPVTVDGSRRMIASAHTGRPPSPSS